MVLQKGNTCLCVIVSAVSASSEGLYIQLVRKQCVLGLGWMIVCQLLINLNLPANMGSSDQTLILISP
jgi:hypothetical protein